MHDEINPKPMTSQQATRDNSKTLKNRTPAGHNTGLDDFLLEKIIDNDPTRFGQVRPSPQLQKLRMELIH